MWREVYDIIVVGAGHAGCEAALAGAKMGMKTLLVTMDLDRMAQMSCNPAIGGLAKGHLVREIDALGGIMGRVIDATGIHFKMLGTSRGPAVHGPRAQADKKAYQQLMKQILEQTPNLSLRQDKLEKLLVSGGKIEGGVGDSGATYCARAVILTTGTFLNGLIHIGLTNYPGGRASEPRSTGISRDLEEMGFTVGRLKTGTPPRLHGSTIDYTVCGVQEPDDPPRPFSFQTRAIENSQILCHITYTNPETHNIIRENLDRSPLYTGVIKSTGPRYCPSIEDKVVKFPDRNRHQIFLEPEGKNTREVYANGISTSLPQDVQLRYVRSIKGLENAEIMRFAYGIEYDFVPPTQVFPTMETKLIEGLYHAGQINGTTGYEEAAAQGLMAGINAALKLQGKPPFTLGRDQAYIGVLLDDLVTRDPREPYRMFTSRAEYRLLLRHDNADRRLMPDGYRLGLIPDGVYQNLCDKERKIHELTGLLRDVKHGNEPLAKILRRPEVNWSKLCEIDGRLGAWNDFPRVIEQVEIEIKYEGYLARQAQEIRKMQRMENLRIPPDTDYRKIIQLKRECRENLALYRPGTLGQASRIAGVTPADISVLMIYLTNSEYRDSLEKADENDE